MTRSLCYRIEKEIKPTEFWHCWLGGRKSIESIKMSNKVLVWLSVWSKVQADASAIP